MKTIYTIIVMGLLALAPCKAAVPTLVYSAATSSLIGPELTEARVRNILMGARPQLEAQLNRTLTSDFLYQQYQDGFAKLTYLGFDGTVHVYRVDFGGGIGVSGLENI
jgi:hypothetical protein